MTPERASGAALARALDAALPQTQCTRCGYPDCRSYAQAIAHEDAPINQCPPGGQDGVRRLAALTGREPLPLNPQHGAESPLRRAVVDEAWCIGCTLCLQACPVDCIVGAPKLMHTVVAPQCTGCELCLPACPVDCIEMSVASGARTGWQAWSPAQAVEARERYEWHRTREHRDGLEQTERLARPAATHAPSGVVQAALARARAARDA